MSQEQLAVRLQLDGLGLTQKAISWMETGERVVADYELVHLARALEVGVLELLGLEP
ncbi:helix-turn-helix domain-containing protein [Flavonifractor plautii]|uniref:helix-turn-helix domain-containing protein n=1 Tax=Flavonifractor plautii TaxID=292800 RepID=UPI002901A408|nr:helix-turn-helix transcriptional regulator [Flavonifractor plautii]